MDLVLYDTYTIEPGQRERFFRNANIGYVHRTNLQIAGQFGDRTFVVTSIGLRLLGKTRDEEDLLLDHLHLQFNIGDHSMATVMGPHASMLQHVYRADELAGEEQTANIPPAWALLKALAEAHGYKRQPEDEMPHPEDAAVILDWLEERGIGNIDKIKGDVRFRAPRTGVGYVLARPLIIPVRQNFSAEIDASPRLSEAVLARVHLFGLSVQDVA